MTTQPIRSPGCPQVVSATPVGPAPPGFGQVPVAPVSVKLVALTSWASTDALQKPHSWLMYSETYGSGQRCPVEELAGSAPTLIASDLERLEMFLLRPSSAPKFSAMPLPIS